MPDLVSIPAAAPLSTFAALRRAPTTKALAAAVLLAGCTPSAATPTVPSSPPSLTTVAKQTQYQRTGRYDEVERLCRAFPEVYPGRARCFTFGVTPEGRPMLAIAASNDGALDPETIRARKRPVFLFQGGIHAGEIDGKDGGFEALDDLLEGRAAKGALSAVTAVFVPVFNVDGHERFGPNQRPNQRGPLEMGFRTTAQGLNLNRDYLKAEAPEMRAMIALLEAFDPTVYVDLHTTDGAKFQHDVAVLVEPSAPHPGALEARARSLEDALQARLSTLGHLPVPFYPSFVEDDDPASGFASAPPPPRFSQGYAAARNRIGILVETHSWATNEARIRAMHDLLVALFERAADAPAMRASEEQADAASARLAGTQVALTYRPDLTRGRTIEFRGYAYEKRPSEISGAPWITYDESRPEVWRVPLFEAIVPDLVVIAPRGGYLVPAAFAAEVSDKLRAHGLAYEVLKDARPAFPVEAFRATEVSFGRSYEGRSPPKLKGAWDEERRDLPRGSLFVPIAQPRARMVMHLFEPLAPDSLVAWGFFNTAFERREYMEAYVAEAEARRMLAADPKLREAFEARLADAAFAADPKARLDFFYQRHPAWDERVNLSPILRVASSPVVKAP